MEIAAHVAVGSIEEKGAHQSINRSFKQAFFSPSEKSLPFRKTTFNDTQPGRTVRWARLGRNIICMIHAGSESGNFEPGRFRQSLESSVCAKSTGKVEHALSITFSALIWARNSSKHGTVVHQFISLSLTFNDIRSKSVGTIVWSQLTPKVERFYGDQLISSSAYL